ncbi:MAG: HlyD family efflux transporter periplasmic adaptor subunit [Pirellulaceae bacterium]|jgi:putative peptide zinc metalloprotease protein|nr:HlyD family efflux transporter periplasmic adaptor subunit [Pirellulaceae bacterium]
MTTLAESLISSTSRPLTLRMRPDLSARRHRYHGRTFWVVKEPVGLNYFRFHEEEYAILCMLDGHSSLDDIKDQFEREFAPQKITFHDLLQFVGMLHRSGLVISESSGQGKQLVKRRDEKKWRELMGKLANVFALRFRGVDPERFFNAIYPYTGWFFRWPTVVCVMLLGLAALTLVGVQFDEFSRRLPTFHSFFGPQNWFYLAITMAVVKVLHEFGHGLSCKHFGGECHELGAMLLVFTPALYCNVSDSWMLPSKWHRAAIGAAGMYVEIFLASVATFLWWFSAPGLFNHICLSVMFICSVSTVIFNGNPLLRFDGYYILMDLLEIPNLRQKSTEITRRFFVWLCLGIEQPENPFLPQKNQWAFALYTIAAVMYRWVVVFSIMFFLNKVLEPYGLKILGQLMAVAGLFGLIVQPLWELGKFFTAPGRTHKMKKERIVASLAVVGAIIAFVLFVPLPFSVKCTFEVQPREAQHVFTSVPGQLTLVSAKPGKTVEAGETIVQLSNPDLEFEVLALDGKRQEAENMVLALRDQKHVDPAAVDQEEMAREMAEAARKQYAAKKEELDRLTIKAPAAGTIIPPPSRSAKAASAPGQLPSWTGTPFDDKNLGALITPGDPICIVADPQDVQAVLVVDQAYVDLVKEGQPVRVLLESDTRRAYDSHVESIAAIQLEAVSRTSSTQAGGRLETKMDPSGMFKPLSTSYQAAAPLPELGGTVQVGMQGQARIYTGWQPLGRRLYRFVAKTFHFDL